MGDEPEARTTSETGSRARRRRSHLLLVLPFAALLAVPLYAREVPSLWGWPFFYWYQFAWGLITIVLMALVARGARAPATNGPDADPDQHDPAR